MNYALYSLYSKKDLCTLQSVQLKWFMHSTVCTAERIYALYSLYSRRELCTLQSVQQKGFKLSTVCTAERIYALFSLYSWNNLCILQSVQQKGFMHFTFCTAEKMWHKLITFLVCKKVKVCAWGGGEWRGEGVGIFLSESDVRKVEMEIPCSNWYHLPRQQEQVRRPHFFAVVGNLVPPTSTPS